MAVSKTLRYAILTRDRSICRVCGGRAPEKKLEVDHIIPVALGGTDAAENLRTTCEECNSGKGSTPPDAAPVAAEDERACRWTAAMQQVAQERTVEMAAAREVAVQIEDRFLALWNKWTYRGLTGKKCAAKLPPDWRNSLHQILSAGLVEGDFEYLIHITMTKALVRDRWSYFCGCSWNLVNQAHQRALEVVESGNRDGD